MTMKRRKGVFLLWSVIVVAVVLLLVPSVFFGIRETFHRERIGEVVADEMFLVQEVLEIQKYNRVFHESVPYPTGEVMRNGRVYQVSIKERRIDVDGVPLTELVCTVSANGKFSFSAALDMEVSR